MSSVIESAKLAISESSLESSVYVGCDSIRFKKNDVWHARYSTVIVLHIDSCKGCKLFHTSEVQLDYGNLKQRLMTEVYYAVAVATEIVDVIGDRYLAVHLDLNKSPKHKSYIAVQEALGYVRGNLPDVDVCIKPDAFASTSAADHTVRRKGK